jgi:hypothetical protein
LPAKQWQHFGPERAITTLSIEEEKYQNFLGRVQLYQIHTMTRLDALANLASLPADGRPVEGSEVLIPRVVAGYTGASQKLEESFNAEATANFVVPAIPSLKYLSTLVKSGYPSEPAAAVRIDTAGMAELARDAEWRYRVSSHAEIVADGMFAALRADDAAEGLWGFLDAGPCRARAPGAEGAGLAPAPAPLTELPSPEDKGLLLRNAGVFVAAISLSPGGAGVIDRVAVYSPDEPQPRSRQDCWRPSAHLVFRMVSASVMTASDAYRAEDPATCLERTVQLLAWYRAVFEEPCAGCAKILLLDPATREAVFPTFRHPRYPFLPFHPACWLGDTAPVHRRKAVV